MRVTSKLSTRKGEKINPDQLKEKLASQRKNREDSKETYSRYKLTEPPAEKLAQFLIRTSASRKKGRIKTFMKNQLRQRVCSFINGSANPFRRNSE